MDEDRLGVYVYVYVNAHACVFMCGVFGACGGYRTHLQKWVI